MQSVWQPKSMDQYVLLPEENAVRSFFDTLNCRALYRLLVPFVVAAIIIALILAAQQRTAGLLLPLVNLVLIRLLYQARDRPILTQHFRLILISYLIVQTLLWKGVGFDPAVHFHPADFLAPGLLLFFRLPPAQLMIPIATYWSLAAGRNLVVSLLTSVGLELGGLIGQTIICLVAFITVTQLTHRRHRDFLDTWRREHHRFRERRRMQEELDDARKIQLSMLPRREPRIPWLDVAGISVPASEVGGDYYDYFTISEDQQAIVVGDVAGHGVASGLLLSGIRSCLHLLRETPLAPAEILAKLDRMVRQTTGRRMFVTLLYALFDRAARTLTLAAAGHPPLLRLSASSGLVDEFATPALPLGTGIESTLREITIPFHVDDIFLLYTDGIAETLNAHGELYGDERLCHRLRTVPPERRAKEIRDLILGNVWSFKGDGEQLDDITVVVVKVREDVSQRPTSP